MLQEVLRANIETKLNNNTKDVEIIVGQYYQGDDEQEFVYNIKNGYRFIEKTYIPTMMTFSADYKAIPSSITGFATITLNFLIAVDSDKNDKLLALEELVAKVVANYESISDTPKTYYTVWNMDAITPGGIARINGYDYIQLSTTIYIEFSDKFYFGNQWQYWLGQNRIYPYSSSTERKMEVASPHILGEKEATSLSETAIWSAANTFWIDSTLSTMLDSMIGSYDMSTTYTLKIVTPTNSTGISLTVLIDSYKANTDLGEKATITLSFVKTYVE